MCYLKRTRCSITLLSIDKFRDIFINLETSTSCELKTCRPIFYSYLFLSRPVGIGAIQGERMAEQLIAKRIQIVIPTLISAPVVARFNHTTSRTLQIDE